MKEIRIYWAEPFLNTIGALKPEFVFGKSDYRTNPAAGFHMDDNPVYEDLPIIWITDCRPNSSFCRGYRVGFMVSCDYLGAPLVDRSELLQEF